MHNDVYIHFIVKGRIIYRRTTKFPPLIGDEIRLPGPAGKEAFFEVLRRVWAYDETDHAGERLNIAVKLNLIGCMKVLLLLKRSWA